jgi:hypothetical protein
MATTAITLASQVTTLQADLKTTLESFFASLPEMESNVAMSTALVEQAQKIVVFRRGPDGKIAVADGAAYVKASEQTQALKSVAEEITELMDPFISKLFAAHRAATGIRSKYLTPIETETKRLKLEREGFAAEEERKRQEIARAAQEEERKRQEAALIEEARLAAQSGNAAVAEAILDEAMNVEVAPVAVPSTTPQVQGTNFRTAWEFEVKDWTKLKPEFIKVDEVAIGKIVRSMHKAAEQLCGGPGAIRVWDKQIIVDR